MSQRTDPKLYRDFTGLSNTVTEERLSESDLSVAQNIDIDDAGQIRRRRGFSLVAAGNFHSLHQNGEVWYVVKDEDFCALYRDYTTTVLQAGVGPDFLAYADVGETTYFVSSSFSGVVSGGSVSPWGAGASGTTFESPVVNPTANLPLIAGKLTSPPPLATSITYLDGRIYLADGELIWATELYRYHYIDRNKNYLYFEQPVRQIIAVSDGIYAGTDDAVYFLSGPFGQMSRRKVADAGIVARSAVYVDPKRVGQGDQQSKLAVMFLTRAGLYVGFDSGVCLNLTQDKFLFPSSQSAAAMFRQQDGMSQYVGVTNSSGDPSNSARFGDYVDVEIRRFSGN